MPSPEKWFDNKAGLSLEEKKYLSDNKIEDVYAKISVQKLYAEVMSNIHNENRNKVTDWFLAPVQLSKSLIEATLAKNTDVWDRYKKYNISKEGKTLAMSDQWIALVQALAEACVNSLPDGSSVKKILKETQYFTSHKEIDGFMWPNTTFLFEKIAKSDLGDGNVLPFDGTITPQLILKMYKRCNTAPQDKSNQVQNILTPEQKIIAIDKSIADLQTKLSTMQPSDPTYQDKIQEIKTLEEVKKTIIPQDPNVKKTEFDIIRDKNGKPQTEDEKKALKEYQEKVQTLQFSKQEIMDIHTAMTTALKDWLSEYKVTNKDLKNIKRDLEDGTSPYDVYTKKFAEIDASGKDPDEQKKDKLSYWYAMDQILGSWSKKSTDFSFNSMIPWDLWTEVVGQRQEYYDVMIIWTQPKYLPAWLAKFSDILTIYNNSLKNANMPKGKTVEENDKKKQDKNKPSRVFN